MERFYIGFSPHFASQGKHQKEGAHLSSPSAEQLFAKGTCCNFFLNLSPKLPVSTFFLQETKSNCKSFTSLQIQLHDFTCWVLQVQHILPLNCKGTGLKARIPKFIKLQGKHFHPSKKGQRSRVPTDFSRSLLGFWDSPVPEPAFAYDITVHVICNLRISIGHCCVRIYWKGFLDQFYTASSASRR